MGVRLATVRESREIPREPATSGQPQGAGSFLINYLGRNHLRLSRTRPTVLASHVLSSRSRYTRTTTSGKHTDAGRSYVVRCGWNGRTRALSIATTVGLARYGGLETNAETDRHPNVLPTVVARIGRSSHRKAPPIPPKRVHARLDHEM